MAGTGYPVTQGYTINIVKDKAEQAVILLNPAQASKSFYITVPESGRDNFEHKANEKEIVLNNEKTDDFFYFVEDGTEEVICSEVMIEDDMPSEVVADRSVRTLSESVETDNLVNEVTDPVVYYQENHQSDSSGFFTEVAHEEIVIEEVLVDNVVENRKPGCVISSVQCDLCNSRLSSAEEAKNHMKHIHNILTYEGPFFKCEFCGLHVTDRVSHMKVAHYSPLAQAFCKTNNTYQCLQCQYTSDQLTNIRNHVDAKHRSGDNKYLCEECNSEYKTLNSMRAHKSRVHVKKRRLVELNRLHNPRPDLQLLNISKDQQLQKEILELEQKTFSKFVKRRNNS
jgi:transposase-like protein